MNNSVFTMDETGVQELSSNMDTTQSFPEITLTDITNVTFMDGFGSPPRRRVNVGSPTSPLPFSTSPNDLQNTLKEGDADKFTFGAKGQGTRSVKEFEDQLSFLKKENFNLKLRIYFLEEKLGVNFPLNEDNALKKNIEMKVEIANLQKELQEKHILLCQAHKAIELEEEEHKKNVQAKEEQLNLYQQEIEDLRTQAQDFKFDDNQSHKSEPTGFIFNRGFPLQDTESSYNFRELQNKCEALEKELNSEKENNASLQILLDQTDSIRQKLEAAENEVEEKQSQIAKWKKEMEDLRQANRELSNQLQQSNRDNQNLLRKMEEETAIAEDLIGQVNELKKKYSNVKLEIEREHKKAERVKMLSEIKIVELESENEKNKGRAREMSEKLEIALNESKKNHNLAVSSCQVQTGQATNTDQHVSGTHAATDNRTSEKDALSLSLNNHVLSPSSLALEKFDVEELENILFMGSGEKNDIAQKFISNFKKLKSDYSIQKQKILKIKTEQFKACEIIKKLMQSRDKAIEGMNELRQRCDELEYKLKLKLNSIFTLSGAHEAPEKDISAANDTLENAIVMNEEHLTKVVLDQYRSLCEDLQVKANVLKATLEIKDGQLLEMKEDNEGLRNKVIDMEFHLISQESKDVSEKDKEIVRLKTELKKCTCYLQEIVNKELWDKNREIERMHTKQTNQQEVQKLRKQLSDKDLQLKVLFQKISELGLEIPMEVPPGGGDFEVGGGEGKLAQSLKSVQEENECLLDELNKYKQLYLEAGNIGAILSNRLEELAIFLDYLLKQKSVLGFLGSSKYRKVREIIHNTFELSRSFNVSITINPEQSLTQLTNITALLNGSTLQDLSLEGDLEVEESKSVLPVDPWKLDVTYQQDQPPSEIHSESEAWSEPDIRVSKARIGLSNTVPLLDRRIDSTDDEELNNDKYFGKKCSDLSKEIEELKHELHEKNQLLSEADDRVDQRFRELNERIQVAEGKCEEYNQEIATLQITLEEVNRDKKQLEESMVKKDKELVNMLNTREVERSDLLRCVEVCKAEADDAKNQLKIYENKLAQVNEDWEIYKEDNRRKLQANHDEIESLTKDVQQMNDDIAQLRDQLESSTKSRKSLEESVQTLKTKLSAQILEKTKLENEKYQLEVDVHSFTIKEGSMKEKIQEIQREHADLRQTCQRQCSLLQTENSKLELKVSELESSNAEFHNKLIRMQASASGSNLGTSLPNGTLYVSKAPYEDLRSFNNSVPQNLISVNYERNSSPDLGIESDHGRFSSLENHTVVPGPVQQTIDLTESMNNLLSMEDNVECDKIACRKKLQTMARINNELKRKLLRTRGLLEETHKRKNQVEKEISKQIYKTSEVLRIAKANLDSNSESEK